LLNNNSIYKSFPGDGPGERERERERQMRDYSKEWFTLEGSELVEIAEAYHENPVRPFWKTVHDVLKRGSDSEAMKKKEAMTYRQIRGYAERENWYIDSPSQQRALDSGLLPDEPESMPWAVERWLTHELLPTIRKTGAYEWPENLDAVCPATVLQAA
jgi:hypothetical protein